MLLTTLIQRVRPYQPRSRSSTEQIIPSPRRSSFDAATSHDLTNVLRREVVDENMTMRLLLLAPLILGTRNYQSQAQSEDESLDLEKSTLDLYSHSGFVNVELVSSNVKPRRNVKLTILIWDSDSPTRSRESPLLLIRYLVPK